MIGFGFMLHHASGSVPTYNFLLYIYHSLRNWACHLYKVRPKPTHLFVHLCCFHFISIWALKPKIVFRQKVGRVHQSFFLLLRRGPNRIIHGLALPSYFHHLQLPLRSLLLEKREIWQKQWWLDSQCTYVRASVCSHYTFWNAVGCMLFGQNNDTQGHNDAMNVHSVY